MRILVFALLCCFCPSCVQTQIPEIVVVNNPDGTHSSECTISVETLALNDGRITVIPTIWEGRRLDPKQAISLAVESGLCFRSFDTHEQADEFAATRSLAGGATTFGFLGYVCP